MTSAIQCRICGYAVATADPNDTGLVQGNTQRFKHRRFSVWKCPHCLSIHSLEPVDFHDIYKDYALNKRRLDVFARGTLKNLLGRLQRAGLKPTDTILDYGCGNGLFVAYLRERGYPNVIGYDPYMPDSAKRPSGPFDWVVNNDTLEHVDDPRQSIRECIAWLKPGGSLYVGTPDSEPVEMNKLESQIMRFHQPFHRIMVTEKVLHQLGTDLGLEVVAAYRRSYHDTLRPFSNYRFLDEMNQATGHDLDVAMDPAATTSLFLRSPRLWFFALFGYFFPSAYEPAVIFRRPLHHA